MSAVRLLPWTLHEGLEYLAGIFLILAPFLLGFSDEPALPVFAGVGVVVLVLAVLSRGPLGVVGVLPTTVHAAADYLVGFLLVLAPFLFGFADVEPALYTSVLLGVAHLVITLLTRFPVRAPAPAPPETAGGSDTPAAGGG